MNKLRITGNRFGDALLVGIFLMVVSVGILTSQFLLKYDSGGANLVTYQVKDVQLEPSSIVFMGDSLAQGIGASDYSKSVANQTYQSFDIKTLRLWNISLAGSTSEEVKTDQLPRLSSLKPQRIYLIIGANDVRSTRSAADFKVNYQAILTGLEKTKAQIVVLNIPKLSLTPAIPETRKEEIDQKTIVFNEIIKQTVVSSRVQLVDLYTFSAKELTPDSGLLSDDKFHPNDAGYQKMTEYILKSTQL